MADYEFPFPIDPMEGNITPTKRTPEEKVPATPEHIKRETEKAIMQAIRLEKLQEHTRRKMAVIVRDAKDYPGYISKEEEEYANQWLKNYNRTRMPMPLPNNDRRSNAQPYTPYGGKSRKSKKGGKKKKGTKKCANRNKN
jgi:hypothetical protein